MVIERRKLKTGVAYEVRLRDPHGREYSRTFRTKKAAEQFQHTERADRVRGGWVDPRRSSVRFEDVAEEWLISNPGKKPSSGPGPLLARHPPHTGLRRLTRREDHPGRRPTGSPAVVDDSGTPYGATTVCGAPGRADLRRGHRSDRPVRHRIVTPEELHRLADAMGEDFGPMAYLAAVLGLRWGECAGLKVGAVDFESSTIAVTSQLTRGPKGVIVDGAP
jgi:hypothetical protein